MIITFQLQGVERKIVYDGYCFKAIDPREENRDYTLGYYQNLGGAIKKHIQDASVLDHEGKQELLTLKEYVLRYEALVHEVLGFKVEVLYNNPTFVQKETPPKRSSKNTEVEPKEVDFRPELIEGVELVDDEDDLDI